LTTGDKDETSVKILLHAQADNNFMEVESDLYNKSYTDETYMSSNPQQKMVISYM
jgi:hypothetical protein